MAAGLRIHGLTAGYRGRIALHDLTADLPGGAVTAVLGPNGSGKSTLLAAVAGVLRPAAGRVERGPGTRLAFVVQHSAVPATLPITVAETVAMSRWSHRGPWRRLTRADTAIVDACLDRLHLTELAGRRLDTLSGGQRQRTLLAQAMAQRADILLLDEPTVGLDAHSRRIIADLLVELAADGATIVQATHHPDEVLAATHCLLLEAGHLRAQGDPASILGGPAAQLFGHEGVSFDRNALARQSIGLR
ncbi:metal ABC transporter ATP-binding protein [Nocardia farcinica]|uniref:zinc ABC transporter ATP-binding protein AztA n=1 Tax=Nocardia farcinica TaxID=37329 RepID=UPI00189510EF|nr:zinc ABC transporter ATP-binding protein AztA [Nocardia farcinica]MBF6359462.1 metal ABC transporter ATP-binding protein [Nocardia farcinica]